MKLEEFAQLLVYTHAGFGGVALLAGAFALTAKKGGPLHKKSGKVFFYAMLFSACISLVIAMMPNHESAFLFSVGVFSSYFLLSGFRSLNFNKSVVELTTDKFIAYAIIVAGIAMIVYPIILYRSINMVLLVFGLVGLIFGVRDLRLYADTLKLRQNWLKLHLGKMTGGYISAVTAFFVVNHILPGLWNWFTPGLVGGVFIAYWMRKLDNKRPQIKLP